MRRTFRTQAEQAAYALGVADAAKEPDAEKLTMDEIKAMSTQEVAERLPEINAVLGGGGQR